MSKYYKDYVWRNGIPYGICSQKEPMGSYYKIPMDPYRKRITIEYYENNLFKKIIYDSSFLDFRHLKQSEQTGWQKMLYANEKNTIINHLRNQEDRLICIETCLFRENYCVECRLHSPHGILISIHLLYYEQLKDPFNGVVLFDSNNHKIMSKKYSLEKDSLEFSEILEEQWVF